AVVYLVVQMDDRDVPALRGSQRVDASLFDHLINAFPESFKPVGNQYPRCGSPRDVLVAMRQILLERLAVFQVLVLGKQPQRLAELGTVGKLRVLLCQLVEESEQTIPRDVDVLIVQQIQNVV